MTFHRNPSSLSRFQPIAEGGDYLKDPKDLEGKTLDEKKLVPNSGYNGKMYSICFQQGFIAVLTNIATRISAELEVTDLSVKLRAFLDPTGHQERIKSLNEYLIDDDEEYEDEPEVTNLSTIIELLIATFSSDIAKSTLKYKIKLDKLNDLLDIVLDDKSADGLIGIINSGIRTEIDILEAFIKFLILNWENSEEDFNQETIDEIFLNSYPEILRIALTLNLNQIAVLSKILRRKKASSFFYYFSLKKNKDNKTYASLDLDRIFNCANEEEIRILNIAKNQVTVGCPMARISKFVRNKIGESQPEFIPKTLIRIHIEQIARIMPELLALYTERKLAID
jgi:hypothetical protein